FAAEHYGEAHQHDHVPASVSGSSAVARTDQPGKALLGWPGRGLAALSKLPRHLTSWGKSQRA
ncbi:MAG TPA: hypothetical protein VFN75_07515, partial [Pseudonocardiaceae bacterium]|nr:hypothetical protein [Pseudonocardiaceae bacterium]